MQRILKSVEFEVFGKVQGVFFRKFTRDTALKYDLRGWCANTPNKSVIGVIEGESNAIEQMKHWLQNEGSPNSQISRASFRNEKKIDSFSFETFEIKKHYSMDQ